VTEALGGIADVDESNRHHVEERGGGWSISRIDLDTEASISDMATAFQEYAQKERGTARSGYSSGVKSVSFIALGSSSPISSCDMHARW
jgi:hypothetical protein